MINRYSRYSAHKGRDTSLAQSLRSRAAEGQFKARGSHPLNQAIRQKVAKQTLLDLAKLLKDRPRAVLTEEVLGNVISRLAMLSRSPNPLMWENEDKEIALIFKTNNIPTHLRAKVHLKLLHLFRQSHFSVKSLMFNCLLALNCRQMLHRPLLIEALADVFTCEAARKEIAKTFNLDAIFREILGRLSDPNPWQKVLWEAAYALGNLARLDFVRLFSFFDESEPIWERLIRPDQLIKSFEKVPEEQTQTVWEKLCLILKKTDLKAAEFAAGSLTHLNYEPEQTLKLIEERFAEVEDRPFYVKRAIESLEEEIAQQKAKQTKPRDQQRIVDLFPVKWVERETTIDSDQPLAGVRKTQSRIRSLVFFFLLVFGVLGCVGYHFLFGQDKTSSKTPVTEVKKDSQSEPSEETQESSDSSPAVKRPGSLVAASSRTAAIRGFSADYDASNRPGFESETPETEESVEEKEERLLISPPVIMAKTNAPLGSYLALTTYWKLTQRGFAVDKKASESYSYIVPGDQDCWQVRQVVNYKQEILLLRTNWGRPDCRQQYFNQNGYHFPDYYWRSQLGCPQYNSGKGAYSLSTDDLQVDEGVVGYNICQTLKESKPKHPLALQVPKGTDFTEQQQALFESLKWSATKRLSDYQTITRLVENLKQDKDYGLNQKAEQKVRELQKNILRLL
ncbi:hypothetical protein A2291_00550 [candidate division WOR-1 bacterium RIFOXYB2_FULL_42_35]|uniref:Uncharacterized protein n=1 Tax=candidate division WOR-1 bacterium RIFOXYC2_FULL_41_25 TaxID=1802586 RepID=A0A1F4TJW3_UNCSA|nr:MAG: hypothetical protein A2247_06825 [candidate division WOR-1 bacterium RIFOXYA2_FULL_41_14]OGC23461.1 MAG: hypothetical protein A2291_00550 [candidate division WOR-1 bacterium RIFOXYB2_FULL_42_35]OGC32984.1 MAG: hypothetical protein A2462_03595 [candidate division WOR-1 bacterium RIFOXYC2_FULL_41_25]OGC44107.1 MAG: hypothetical protein A2548_06545 [candidate division WOR-1 bacterium RIFOXYD2_FULL_41_8]